MDEQKNITSEFAIASLTLGALSFFQLFGMEKAIAAIVFGSLALKRIGVDAQLKGKKFAIAGIALGVIAIIATSVFIIRFWPQLMQMQQRMMQK